MSPPSFEPPASLPPPSLFDSPPESLPPSCVGSAAASVHACELATGAAVSSQRGYNFSGSARDDQKPIEGISV